MIVSRIVAAAFVLIILAFVIVATALKDPADSATRLPADVDVRSIELASEPFDLLAKAYENFDIAAAGEKTRTLIAEQLTNLAVRDLDFGLDPNLIAQLIGTYVEQNVTDEDIEQFHAVLVHGVPTVETDQISEQDDEAGQSGSTNPLVLSASEQRVINFGDTVGTKATELMLAMQVENGIFDEAIEGQQNPALKTAIQPRLTRVQRVAYLEIPVEMYRHRDEVTGSTSVNRRSQVRARTGSTVARIYADRGDYVDAGQVLLTLDEDGRQAQRLQAVAAIAQAEANLISAEAAIGSAQAQFAQAETSLQDAQDSQADVLALGEFASATQQRNAASAVDQAVQSLNVAQAGLAQAEANLAQSQATLESARASLVQIDLDIDRLTVTAPFSGRIETRNVESGSSVNPGETLFVLADFETMIATARVSDRLRQTLTLGTIAEVIVGDRDQAQSFKGPITLIDSTSDPATRTFEVEVELTNAFDKGQPKIVDNQFATLVFSQDPEPMYRVPQSSLTSASITSKPDGTTGLLTIDSENRMAFTEITFADYNDGGELLIHQNRLGPEPIKLIVGRGGFVKIGDRVMGRQQMSSKQL